MTHLVPCVYDVHCISARERAGELPRVDSERAWQRIPEGRSVHAHQAQAICTMVFLQKRAIQIDAWWWGRGGGEAAAQVIGQSKSPIKARGMWGHPGRAWVTAIAATCGDCRFFIDSSFVRVGSGMLISSSEIRALSSSRKRGIWNGMKREDVLTRCS
jgi:hypothetical protein